jgi:bacillithiol system protein YtxJ
MDRFLRDQSRELEYEFVDVIENRSRSNEVAEIYGIRHESPQVIILDDAGDILWHASHYDITEQSIGQAISGIS